MCTDDLPPSAGGVELWWIRRPAPPRTTVPRAAATGVILVAVCLAAMMWSAALSPGRADIWPWSIGKINSAQVAMRYLSVFLVAWVYVVLRSLASWVRSARQARRDLTATSDLVMAERWPEAARTLHRCCLLWRDVWGRLPARAPVLDEIIRTRLQPRRRLYVYYVGSPPAIPDTPEAGFAPRVVPGAMVGWWTMVVFVALAATTYAELTGALRSQQWRVLRAVNFAVLACCLLGYAYVYVMTALGKRQYYRFAPGVAQLLTFGIIGLRAKVQSICLRKHDAILDVRGSSVLLAVVQPAGAPGSRSCRLARRPDVIETCLRAVLSTAPVREMPDAQLID